LGSSALAVRDLLKAEAFKEILHHVVFLGRKVMAGNPFRAVTRGVGKDVVHGEAFDAALQDAAAHQIFVDFDIAPSVLKDHH
jgi:hypothetical protein